MRFDRYALLFLAGAALSGLASCTDETGQDSLTENGEMIFSARVSPAQTKVTENAWDGDERIGVEAGGEVNAYTIDALGNMTPEDGAFRWEGEPFTLKAWCPLTADDIDLTDQSTEEKFFGCDLLASSAEAGSKRVHFTFSHRMTRMWWELSQTDGYTEQEVNDAVVTFFGYGEVSYEGGVLTPAGEPEAEISVYNVVSGDLRAGQAMMVPCDMWEKPLIRIEIGGDTYVYTPSRSDANDAEKNTGVLKPGIWQKYYLAVNREMLTVDVDMASSGIGWESGSLGEVVDARYRVTVPAEVAGLENYSEVGLSDGYVTDKEAGFKVTYIENVPSGGLVCDGSCEVSRTENPDGTVTFSFSDVKSDLVLSHTDEYVETGYYFYSDGTYGSEYKENAVGVVFYAGQHPTDDPAYYDGLGTIHGYVVALTDESEEGGGSGFRWKTDASIDMTKGADDPEYGVADGNTELYIGYADTRYLLDKAQNNGGSAIVPAAAASETKNAADKIPGTSGWYLPSRTQLLDIASLAGLPFDGYSPLTDIYWSASFDGNGMNAYVVQFDAAGAVANEREFYRASDSLQKVRLILTF